MAQSIFLGPHNSGTVADNLRTIEEKLNAEFAAAFAKNPALAGSRQVLRLHHGSEAGAVDSVAVTQSKINQMLRVLSQQAGLSIEPVTLDARRADTAGITPDIANKLSVALYHLGSVASLGTLGLSPTAVTRSVAYTGTISGATAGSTLGATGLPTGLVINSGARTITGTTTVSAGSYPIVVTETLAGRWGSPKASNFTLTVA